MAKKKASKKKPATKSLKTAPDSELTPEQLKKREQAREWSRRSRAKAAERKLMATLVDIPQSSTAARELAWIRAHPAMSRGARQGSTVILTAEDVLSPPHGKAPSQSAVNQLQHWVNKPDEFFKQLMQVERKQISESSESEALLDDDLPPEVTRIDEMLQLIEGAKPINE